MNSEVKNIRKRKNEDMVKNKMINKEFINPFMGMLK